MSPSQSRKHRGYATQRLIADAMRADGWPYAESVGAGRGGADITGTPGVSIEAKARRGLALGEWMRQAVAQAGAGEVPVLVIRLDGQGPATIDEWPAVLPFAMLRRLLRQAGYGSPVPDPPGDTAPGRDPARADAGAGHDFESWLSTTTGASWLGCMACTAVAGRGDAAGLVHAPRCPQAGGEVAA